MPMRREPLEDKNYVFSYFVSLEASLKPDISALNKYTNEYMNE